MLCVNGLAVMKRLDNNSRWKLLMGESNILDNLLEFLYKLEVWSPLGVSRRMLQSI